MNLSSELKIETPEGIRFSYALAGPVVRCMAWVVDLCVLVLLVFALVWGLSKVAWLLPDLAGAAMLLGWFALSIAYGVALEWGWRGQTIGKRLLRLRVMDVHGFRLRFYQVLLRNLLRAVDSIPFYLIGGAACALSPRAQRLGDLAAGTVVVHHVRPFEPDLEQLLATKFNSLRTVPHLAARLRQRVSPEEATLALQALFRREELEAAPRLELFRELAQHFREQVPYPPEISELLSDEQYVRDVADLLFRNTAPTRPPGRVQSEKAELHPAAAG